MYEALLYQPARADQPKLDGLAVQTSLSPEGLQVETPNGNETWPYSQLQLAWVGKGKVALSRGQQSVYVWHPDLLKQIKGFLSSQQQQTLQQILQQRLTRKFKWLGISILTIAGLGWGSYWLMLRGRDLAISQIPPAWEQQLGEKVYTEMLQETPACTSQTLTSAINQLQTRLARGITNSPYSLKFKVVKSAQINAAALPGGFIAINAALLAKAPSPEAVLGVMAHESEHVLQRHGIKGLVNKLGISLTLPLILGDSGALMGVLTSASIDLLSLGFDRSQESEADALGLQLLAQAHINPQGMADFFRWMSTEEAKAGSIPEFLSTHPLSSAREAQIQTLISQLPPQTYAPIQLDWPKIQAAAKACQKVE